MRALIVVDLQNDFLPGGSLAVPRGDEVVPVANAMVQWFNIIAATRDWHPHNHGSFAINHPGKKPGDVITLNGLRQELWPPHCVQNTHGAEFSPQFDTRRLTYIVHKGTNPYIDSYSTFFDNGHQQATGLHDYLRSLNVSEIFIMGLATDYCVLYSVRDASHLGYAVNVITDGCRGINLQPGDVERAYAEMRELGAVLITSDQVRAEPDTPADESAA